MAEGVVHEAGVKRRTPGPFEGPYVGVCSCGWEGRGGGQLREAQMQAADHMRDVRRRDARIAGQHLGALRDGLAPDGFPWPDDPVLCRYLACLYADEGRTDVQTPDGG